MSQRTTQRAAAAQQTQQQMGQNQVHRDYQSVESTDGVVFSKGNMLVNGMPQVPEEAQRWESSNGVTVYTTVKWHDPTTQEKRVSCNCPGWAMKKKDGPRRCKHTDDMMGIKNCGDRKIDGSTTIRTIKQAEEIVPKFDGRELRGIMFDD